ncbi:MAG TPA: hypothetical protein VIK86_02720 [Candidatus Paceibacterota bacterium]
MNEWENSRIRKVCDILMEFHYMTASASHYDTEDQSIKDQTQKIMDDSCKSSPLALLIKENKWDELFKNERWLSFLSGAQNFSVLEKGLNIPLLFLSQMFPKETEFHIMPHLLRS